MEVPRYGGSSVWSTCCGRCRSSRWRAACRLIGEDDGKCVRMAHLAAVGSHLINGVAALHSDLLKTSVLKDVSSGATFNARTRPAAPPTSAQWPVSS